MKIRRPEEVALRNDPRNDTSNIEYALWKAWLETPEMSEEEFCVIKATDEIQQMQDDVEQLRAELAQQQANAEAQEARIETLEEKNAKLKAALNGCVYAISRLPSAALDEVSDTHAKIIGSALNNARAALAE